MKKQKKILTSNIYIYCIYIYVCIYICIDMYTYCMDYQCICYINIRISYVHICLVYQLYVHYICTMYVPENHTCEDWLYLRAGNGRAFCSLT